MHSTGQARALELIRHCQENQDPFLDLGNLGLRELPDALWELTHLKRLNLGITYYKEDGSTSSGQGEDAFEVRHGDKRGFRNRLSIVPSGIAVLSRLEMLACDTLGIQDISFFTTPLCADELGPVVQSDSGHLFFTTPLCADEFGPVVQSDSGHLLFATPLCADELEPGEQSDSGLPLFAKPLCADEIEPGAQSDQGLLFFATLPGADEFEPDK